MVMFPRISYPVAPLRAELRPLTSLRGIAALAVIAMHFSATMQIIARSNFPSLAPHGALAVDVFFVLSGFIMGYTYLASFRTQSLWPAYRNFLQKRAARILPLNAAITLVLVVVAFASLWLFDFNLVPTVHPQTALVDIFSNILLLPGLGFGTSFNWPAWSISVEFAAYFAFPLFLFLVFSRSRIVFALTCLTAIVGIYASIGPNLNVFGLHNHPWPWRDLLRCVSEFILGLAVYRAYASGRFSNVFARDSVVLAISAVIVTIVLLNLGDLFAMLLFPALILALSLNSGWVGTLMSSRIPYFLGTISFSLYLVTDPFRWPLQHLVKTLHPAPLHPLLAMALAAVFTLLMIVPATISYMLIEKPSRNLLRALIAGTSGKNRVAAPAQSGP